MLARSLIDDPNIHTELNVGLRNQTGRSKNEEGGFGAARKKEKCEWPRVRGVERKKKEKKERKEKYGET